MAGLIEGKSHNEGGVKKRLRGSSIIVEVEGGEFHLPNSLFRDTTIYTYTGTNLSILRQIVKDNYFKFFRRKGELEQGDYIICKPSVNDKTKRKYNGTLAEIIHAINASSGHCKVDYPLASVYKMKKGGFVCKNGKIQSFIFDPKKFTPTEAMAWAKDNKFYVRVRQAKIHGDIVLWQKNVDDFDYLSLRTVDVHPGIRAVVGCLKDKEIKSNKLMAGGLAQGKTIYDIAEKHKVDSWAVGEVLLRGIRIEREHTTDKNIAKDIAMDHLWENINYYTELEKIEKKQEGGLIQDTRDIKYKTYISTPEHAKEYGITAKKPLYIENFWINDACRRQGKGSEMFKEIEKYAKENGCDIIFGHIAQKATIKRKEGVYLSDIDCIKSWLHDRGYAVNDNNNDFHKVIDIYVAFLKDCANNSTAKIEMVDIRCKMADGETINKQSEMKTEYKVGDIVKFTNPQPGEENMLFVIKNVNEVTKRVYIEWLDDPSPLKSQELVGFHHIEKVETNKQSEIKTETKDFYWHPFYPTDDKKKIINRDTKEIFNLEPSKKNITLLKDGESAGKKYLTNCKVVFNAYWGLMCGSMFEKIKYANSEKQAKENFEIMKMGAGISEITAEMKHSEYYPGLIVETESGKWYIILKVDGDRMVVIDEIGNKVSFFPGYTIKRVIGDYENDFAGIGYERHEEEVKPFIVKSFILKYSDRIPGFRLSSDTDKKESIEKKIKSLEILLNATKDKNKKIGIEKRIKSLRILLTQKMALGGLIGNDQININRNMRMNGIEVKFPKEPGYNIMSALKAKGFRWSKFQKLWYVKYTDNLWAWTTQEMGQETQSDQLRKIQEITGEAINWKGAEKTESKKLTNEEILNTSPELKKYYDWVAVKGINGFMTENPIEVKIGSTVYTYEKKKSQYMHLPAGRKRPDYYTFGNLFSKMTTILLKAGVVIPINNIFENPAYYSRVIEYLEQLTKEYPQEKEAPDYQAVYDELKAKENEGKRLVEIWNQWKAEHLTAGQKVFIKTKDGIKEGKLGHSFSSKGSLDNTYSYYEYPDSVEANYGGGYVMYGGKFMLKNIYLENPATGGKNVIEQFGIPEGLEKKETPETLIEATQAPVNVPMPEPEPEPEPEKKPEETDSEKLEYYKKELVKANKLMANPNFTGDITEDIKRIEGKIKELEEKTMKEPESKPLIQEKKYAILKQDYRSTAKGSIGELIKRPNMFTADLYFGKNQTGQELTANVDTPYLEWLKEVPELIKEGKSEKFVIKETKVPETEPIPEPKIYQFFKGIDFDYKNRFELNKAIEELLTIKSEYSTDEKIFISRFSGYGGLQDFGATGKGIMYEYFTPDEVIRKMWALAFKYGYSDGPVIEPSCGIGRFFKYALDQKMCTGIELNETNAKIARILYSDVNYLIQPFEKTFIKNNLSIKDKTYDLTKYALSIGNPPYGKANSLYLGMGEDKYTHANNWTEYFIRRNLDLLVPGGLLIFVIGAEVRAGGVLFLDQEWTTCKKEISEMAELIDAYKLPSGIFEDTGVTTEIIVLRKN